MGEYLEDGVRYIDHSYAKSMSSFDDSLDRLGVDRVDLLYVHAPGGRMAEVLAGAYPACEELRRQGRVTAVGAGVTSAGEGLEFVRSCDIDVLMLAGRYTLLDASAGGELLPLCLDRGIAVVTAGVFNSGILTGAPSETTYDYLPASHDILAAAGVLRDTCDRWGIPLGAVAMRFSALHPAVVSEVVGANTPGQLRQSIQWWRTDIPAGLWEELEAAGLVPPGTAAFATPADGAAA